MKFALLLLASPLLLSGCVDVISRVSSGEGSGADDGKGPHAVGTGKPMVETRHAEAATAIEASGALTVEVRKGAPSLQIEAQREVLPHIRSKFEGGCLHLWTEGSITSDGTMRVSFTTPALSQVSANGATQVDVEGLSGGSVSVELSGASKLQARGQADRMKVEATGASQADLKGVEARQAQVKAMGASKALVTVRENLQATASGASEVRYYGEPAKVDQDTGGASSVRPG